MAFYHILPTSGSLFGVNAATWYVYHILYGACGRDYDQIGQAIYIYIYIYTYIYIYMYNPNISE